MLGYYFLDWSWLQVGLLKILVGNWKCFKSVSSDCCTSNHSRLKLTQTDWTEVDSTSSVDFQESVSVGLGRFQATLDDSLRSTVVIFILRKPTFSRFRSKLFEKTLKQNQFFSWKISCFLKKILNVWNEKILCILVK